MTLAQLIITEARERGLRHFFGLPGGGSPLDMMEAGRQLGVDFVSVAHESSAAIMAAYYGLMKDTAGLALAVKGVGAGNLAAGAANAYFERVPVVCLCESAPTAVTQPELVQTCDHAGLFGAVAKYQATLSAQEGPTAVQQAVFHATDGRPGPVLLNLPSDLGAAACAAPLPRQAPSATPPPEATDLEAARQFIASARRPLIIAGADLVRAGATAELATLVDNIQAAVLVTMDARGVFAESHGRWAGVLVGTYGPHIIESEMLSRADAVLLVGTDAMMSHVPWPSDLPTCELVARSTYHTLTPAPRVRVDGDLKTALRGLANLTQPGFAVDQIQAARQQILRHYERPPQARLAVQDLIEITHQLMPADGVLVSETGILVCALEHLYRVERPGTYWGTSGGRTMGLMLPAVLGAKLAAPNRPMVGFGADGSLLMRLGELETLARTGAAMPLVIVNDQALGTMKSRQKSRRMPEFGLDLHGVDFAQVAAACGLLSATVESPEQFRTALREALQADRARAYQRKGGK